LHMLTKREMEASVLRERRKGSQGKWFCSIYMWSLTTNEFWDFNFGIFYVLILLFLNLNNECEEKREDWLIRWIRFDLVKQ
jgi:hypothetical protein